MQKPEIEFIDTDTHYEWRSVEGDTLGIKEKILSIDPETKSYTRLLKFPPGIKTKETLVHEFWEEVLILEGDLIDGHARTTCNLPTTKADGREVITIEGLAQRQRLHPIQEAFVEAGAIQCGYCTPGMVLRAKDLLDHNNKPGEDEIKEAISGHICRCTGYVKIIEAILLASQKMSKN